MSTKVKYMVIISSLCMVIQKTSIGLPEAAAAGDTVSQSGPLLSSAAQEWRGISEQRRMVSFTVSENGVVVVPKGYQFME